MLPIKRLYTFIYQTFIPVFIMTFGICLFIFIIQFLWQYIADLVGKGLDTSVILELFFYLSLSLVPRVLPLAILLASLMTFGNLGERLELLAIKASGVSLLKIMRPMIILVVGLSVGCFYFQNNLNPKFTVKVASLLRSIKMKSPELDIPEGAFYNLSGYSIYVKHKDQETRMLHDVIIYDTSNGGVKNMSVDVCDSAYMEFAESKDYLTITMHNGQRFQNLKDEVGRSNQITDSATFIPYMRENFTRKEVVIPFEDEFERIEESRYDDTHIAKNMAQLQYSVDSMSLNLDSLNRIDRENVARQSFVAHRRAQPYVDSIAKIKEEPSVVVTPPLIFDFDSVFNTFAQAQKADVLSTASSEARSQSGSHLMYYHIDMPKPILQKRIRDHNIAWFRMFTLPFACLVFFFIGAPLGSIIRKGGLGVPVIISVMLFIFYYIIDNIGYKMARDGVWEVWEGMWLSSAVLFPLGVFLTYKSTKESALFAPEKYKHFFRKVFFVKEYREDLFVLDNNTINIPAVQDVTTDTKMIEDFRGQSFEVLWDLAQNYRQYGHNDETIRLLSIAVLHEKGNDVSELVHDRPLLVMEKQAEEFVSSSYWALGAYILSAVLGIIFLLLSVSISAFFIIPYAYAFIRVLSPYLEFYSRVEKRNKQLSYLGHLLIIILTFAVYPLMFFIVKKNMSKQIKKRRDASFIFN